MIKNVVFVIACITCISCKKSWLDEKPDKNITVPSTLKDFEALLDNSRMYTSAFTIAEAASDGHYILESRWTGSLSDIQRNAYTWSHDRSYLEVGDWNLSYQAILYCNIVLDGLKKVTINNNEEQERFNRIKGNALFHRGRLLYELATIFANSYNNELAGVDPGIPIRLEADITIPSTRSSLQQTYDQIMQDLLTAKDMLPAISQYKTRGSKLSLFGLLSRIYLSMEDYQKAGEYADSCLKIYNSLMDYSKLSTTATFVGLFNSEVILHTTGINYTVVTTGALIDNQLYDSYAANDLRKTILFKNTNGAITFKGNYSNSTTTLFCGIATDEMYLIRAECYARAGKVAEAMSDINDLLRSRWKKNTNGTTTYIDQITPNPNAALTIILAERRKELILRGTRWSDLRRLNKDDRFKITLTRTIGGKIYTLEPNSNKYTFPIPDDIIQQTGMKQNPGWGQ